MLCFSLLLILPCSELQSVVPGHALCYLIYSASQDKWWQASQNSMHLLGLVLSDYLLVYLSISKHIVSPKHTCLIFGMHHFLYQHMHVPSCPEMGCLFKCHARQCTFAMNQAYFSLSSNRFRKGKE